MGTVQTMAESADAFLELPPELRALVNFLEADERPSLIFRWNQRGSEERGYDQEERVKYRNLACCLAGIDREELEKIVSALSACYKPEERRAYLNEAGRKWEVRSVGDDWFAVICHTLATRETLAVRESDNAIGRPTQDVASLKRAHPAKESRENQKQLDWIQYPTPKLSRWQRLILDHNWESTPLGAIKDWTHQLRSIILWMAVDTTPRIVYWGKERAFICNEAFVPLFGIAHPGCLGQPVHTVLTKELLDSIGPYIDSAYEGKPEVLDRQLLQLLRNEHFEETYWDSALTPLIGPDGTCVGVTQSLVESTRAVRGERRRVSVMALGKQIASAVTLKELWSNFLDGLQSAVQDVPYAFIYSAEHDDSDAGSQSTDSNAYTPEKTTCSLEGMTGIQDTECLPHSFVLAEEMLSDTAKALGALITQAWKDRKPLMLNSQDQTLPTFLEIANPDRGFGDKVKQALVIPVTSIPGKELIGVLVVGLCSRCPFDEEYSLWINILGDILLKTAALISLPIEQRRAQKMADDINNALAQQLRITTLQAERSDAKFSRMAKLAPMGMFVVDPEGRPIYLNDAFHDIVPDGLTVDQFTQAKDWTQLIHPDDRGRLQKGWAQLVEEKIPNICECRILKEWRSLDKVTGEEMTGDTWVLATSLPEIEPDGRVSAVMGWITDISKQKAAENLLSKRLEDALETKRQSENFIDMTSHEMRNPLSAILQSADSILSTLQSVGVPESSENMILSCQHAEDVIDSAQIIVLCAQHQKRIVDDILTLSKLDASLLVISPDKVRPPQLVEKALRMYEGEISRANIKTKLVIEPTYEELKVDWVLLDPSRLLQVIINLLTNAVKFTQYSDTREVTIHLGASHQRPTGRHHGVEFIPSRHLKPNLVPSAQWGDGEELFIQFAVSDTGRGLDPEEMKVLFLRFAQASPKTYKQYGGSGLGLFISRELCELQGGQVGVSSNDGKTMFTFYVKAKRWLPDTKADKPPLPRFVSASSSPITFSRRGSATMTDGSGQAPAHTNGSVDFSLDGALQDFGSNAHLSVPNATQSSARSDEQLHVLIVEDNIINQRVMSQQLRRAGLDVHVANHGVECLEFISRSTFSSSSLAPEGASATPLTPLSIVLLDLEMPTMDGLTCIRHIRDREAKGEILGHLPVIAVTANARSGQITKAIDAGMDQVVTKPFRIPELVPQMRKLVAETRDRSGE